MQTDHFVFVCTFYAFCFVRIVSIHNSSNDLFLLILCEFVCTCKLKPLFFCLFVLFSFSLFRLAL